MQNVFAVERKRIADYIRQDALFSLYFEPFLFEELPTQNRSTQTAYLEQAVKAEVYLLLLGKQYGYVDAEGMLTYKQTVSRELFSNTKIQFSFDLLIISQFSYTIKTEHPKAFDLLNKIKCKL